MSNGKMWQLPWGYRESIAYVSGIVAISFLLQLSVGKFDLYLLSAPVNLILGGVMILLLLLFSIKRKSRFYLWFSGVPLCVTLIGAMLIMGIVMGLTPQVIRSDPFDNTVLSKIGVREMTSFWPFVMTYFLLLLSLGALIVRRLISFRTRDYAFYLNHIGLWLLLFAAGLGSADTKRFVMHVQEGETEWRVYNSNGDVVELPIAIQLNDFIMEEYPPRIVIIDRESGDIQPMGRPEYVHIDERLSRGAEKASSDGNISDENVILSVKRISKWDVTLHEYIHNAVRSSDSTYREVYMPGASPAAFVTVTDRETEITKSGWVCSGNSAQLYMTLNIDSIFCVAMTQPEPKRFVSQIDVFTETGKEYRDVKLEVNKPLRAGNWMIYQYGYDNIAGKMSAYSSMELVYDPWLYPAYMGIILLALGAVTLFWQGRGRGSSGRGRKELSESPEKNEKL